MHMKADRLFDIHVRFPVGLTVIASVAVIVLSGAFYYLSSSWKETLIFFAAAVAAAAMVATAFYTARTLNMVLKKEDALRAREDKLDELDRKKRALGYSERWGVPGMHYARDACRQVYEHRGKTAAEIIQFANNMTVKNNIINTLNFFEELAFSLEAGLADRVLLRDAFCGIVLEVFSILKPWIDQERITRGRPNIWIKVEGLYNSWR